MKPAAIRVFPLSRTREPKEFGTIERARDFFLEYMQQRIPEGKFYIPSDVITFKKDSLVLFQYIEKGGEPKIIADAILYSDGCIYSNEEKGYVGYYLFESINFYKNPVTKQEIYDIWNKKLGQSKLNLDISKYNKYVRLCLLKNNLALPNAQI
jgi:hypothetical protein